MDMYYIGDYNKYATFYYPMINYYRYIEPYNHFIVGYKFNNEGKNEIFNIWYTRH